MNTSTNSNSTKAQAVSAIDIAVASSILFLFLFFSITGTAQPLHSNKIKFSAGYETFSSGNGHGGFSAPSISLTKSWNQLIISPILQYKSKTFDGLRVAFSRNLTGASYRATNDDDEEEQEVPLAPEFQSVLQLNFLVYAQYCQNARLSANTIHNEQMIHREAASSYTHMRFNTAEAGIGIELRVNINSFLAWRNYIGAGAYNHLTYAKGLDHERSSTSLQLGTGIQYNF